MNNTDEPIGATYTTSVWLRENLFTRDKIKSITKKATPIQKLRLLFKQSKYSFDDNMTVRYKEMDGMIFVMKRGTKL